MCKRAAQGITLNKCGDIQYFSSQYGQTVLARLQSGLLCLGPGSKKLENLHPVGWILTQGLVIWYMYMTMSMNACNFKLHASVWYSSLTLWHEKNECQNHCCCCCWDWVSYSWPASNFCLAKNVLELLINPHDATFLMLVLQVWPSCLAGNHWKLFTISYRISYIPDL